MKHQTFFSQRAPRAIAALAANTTPKWGSMNATQMMQHLAAANVLLQQNTPKKLEVPEEHLPKYKAFLMSDKPFSQNLPKPEVYNAAEKAIPAELAEAKKAFLSSLQDFCTRTEKDENYCTYHPSFGKLNATEARQLNAKHITHHFTQFGLL